MVWTTTKKEWFEQCFIFFSSHSLQYRVNIFSMPWQTATFLSKLRSVFHVLTFALLIRAVFPWVSLIWILILASLPLGHPHPSHHNHVPHDVHKLTSGCTARVCWTEATLTFPRLAFSSITPFTCELNFTSGIITFLSFTEFSSFSASSFNDPFVENSMYIYHRQTKKQHNYFLCCLWTDRQMHSNQSLTDFRRSQVGHWPPYASVIYTVIGGLESQ